MTATSRSAYLSDHRLQTPETFVRAPLPGLRNAAAIVHVSPNEGAGFLQYTVEFDRGGELSSTNDQRVVYVLDGELSADGGTLDAGAFAYIAGGDDVRLLAHAGARVVVFEKAFDRSSGEGTPRTFFGHERDLPVTHPGGDEWLEVRALIPDERGFDFRVNTMTYRPGAELPAVEIHVMEHGLLMLQGGGIYRLGDRWYEVGTGDVIWMARYCPQWFGAIGKQPAKYIIYKDWDRWPR
jgi:(S)-ureidoglycine aminohydrolase